MISRIFLCAMLGFALTACGRDLPFRPIKPTPRTDDVATLFEFADVLRGESHGDALNDPKLTEVTRDYGPTIIKARKFPFKSEMAVASTRPWSSWWFPKKENFLANDSAGDNTSPLGKYDLWRKGRMGVTSSAAAYERQANSGNVQAWEGLCDAWALAAILNPEPKRAISVKSGSGFWSKDIVFNIGDLKALLLKTYEAVDDSSLKYYGQKFNGDAQSWVYPDLFPEQLHRFIEVQLFDRGQPFVMDHDAGVEVWNVPVYKANYIIDLVPGNPKALFVRLWLYSAESTLATEKNFVGIKEAVREYDYVLEGVRDRNGDFEVRSGYWVKGPDGVDSRKDHPDYVIAVPDPSQVGRKSWNPEIDATLVDELLAPSY